MNILLQSVKKYDNSDFGKTSIGFIPPYNTLHDAQTPLRNVLSEYYFTEKKKKEIKKDFSLARSKNLTLVMTRDFKDRNKEKKLITIL